MKPELKKAFKGLSDRDLRELSWAVSMAENFRSVLQMKVFSPGEICEKMIIKPKDFKAYLECWFPYSIRDIAGVQALIVEGKSRMAINEAGKKENQIVQFPEYEYSKPIKQ